MRMLKGDVIALWRPSQDIKFLYSRYIDDKGHNRECLYMFVRNWLSTYKPRINFVATPTAVINLSGIPVQYWLYKKNG